MTKEKLLVEIIGEFGIKSRKNKLVEQNSVLIEKSKRGRKGHPPYKAEFTKDCILNYKVGIWPFRRLKQKLMLIEGADKCIDFKTGTVPNCDRETLKRLAEAEVLHKAGATLQKLQVPTFVYILLIIIAGLSFLSLLFSSGQMGAYV